MTTQFLIIEDGKIVDGELLDREDVIRTLPRCGAGARIIACDFDEAAKGAPRMAYNHTAGFILGLYAQAWTRAEIEGSPLLSSYIELPVSREEQRADDADARRFEG